MAPSVLPRLSHYLASPLDGLQEKMDESREGNALVREFRRFQEARLKFYGHTLDNIGLEIFLKFKIFNNHGRQQIR